MGCLNFVIHHICRMLLFISGMTNSHGGCSAAEKPVNCECSTCSGCSTGDDRLFVRIAVRVCFHSRNCNPVPNSLGYSIHAGRCFITGILTPSFSLQPSVFRHGNRIRSQVPVHSTSRLYSHRHKDGSNTEVPGDYKQILWHMIPRQWFSSRRSQSP